MMKEVTKVLAFMVEHFDLITLLFEAIHDRGEDKAKIVAAIKASMTAAYDARADAELK